VAALSYTGLHYASLGRYVGLPGYYVVRLDLASGGGIIPNADVTYRGVSVGRVGAIRLTASGVEANLNISDSAPPIPDRLHAAVADLSAVGEQYVDLRPETSSGAYLTSGSVIPERDSQLPLPVTSLLTSINTLASSVPLGSLRELVDALAQGFAHQGGNLQALLDGDSRLARAANAAAPQTIALITSSRTVLATQVAESSALDSFGTNAALLARQLAQSNPSLSQLIDNAPPAATQVAGLLSDNNPSLGALTC
jgi:phospholipid/cholesterol/gamma-HCH transport system substrate-binding protein